MKDAEFRRAKQLHEAGRLAEAERGYRAILSVRPSDADALHMLGLLAHQAGHSAAAIDLIAQSLWIGPENAAAEVDLAAALQRLGRLPEALDVWARILNRVPNSRLLLKALGLGDPPVRKLLLDRLAAEGVAEDRVEFLAWVQTVPEHMQLYDRVDIALDTFPYNGTTTTCEALWMGTPVVTVAGDRHGSRVGVSILSNVGAAELIANSRDDYVRIAAEFAGDEPRLAAYRWMWKRHRGAI